MDNQNSIHISLDDLLAIYTESQKLHIENPDSIPIVKITKTASRKFLDTSDKAEYCLLMKPGVNELIEG